MQASNTRSTSSRFPAKPARSCQNSVAGFGARTLVLPWPGVLASGDNRLRPKLRNRFVTAFGVVGTIAADAGNDLISGNLAEQARQHRRITGSIVDYFYRQDFQCGRINAKVDLAPLATVIGPMLFGLPLTFTRHLDAGAVDQEVQSLCCALFPLRERNPSGRLAAPKMGTTRNF
jgi:hypothetical protein